MRHTIGGSEPKLLEKAEAKVKSVCTACNCGWMSQLETDSIPLIGCLLQDISTTLVTDQQHHISVWAIKTAMMVDSIRPKNPFYSKLECEDFRRDFAIPSRTLIWIGRYFGSSLSFDGVDIGILDSNGVLNIADGTATTIIVGHLVLQVLSFHTIPEYEHRTFDVTPRTRNWNDYLFSIHPASAQTFTWPPRLSFTNSGRASIAHLMNRWRIGRKR